MTRRKHRQLRIAANAVHREFPLHSLVVHEDAIRLMAGMGMGLAFLPALYVRSEIKAEDKDVAVIPLEGPRILRSVGLVTRTGSSDEAAPRIARLIQTVAREVFAGVLIIEP